MHFDKILITTDLSENSFAAFELPAYTSMMDGSEITVLSVVDDWQVPEVFLRQIPNPESIQQYRHDLKEHSQKDLQEAVDRFFHNQNIKAVVQLTNGAAAEEICAYASANAIELIIMASHGKNALEKFFIGSTVQKVIASAPCPVLVVPRASK